MTAIHTPVKADFPLAQPAHLRGATLQVAGHNVNYCGRQGWRESAWPDQGAERAEHVLGAL